MNSMRRWLRGLMLACLSIAIGGCAIGNKQEYGDVRGKLAFSGHGWVSVLAFDQRPYVLNDNKAPDFVGLQRNNYGIPFNVKTKSKRPLAAEMSDAFARSLGASGYAARSVPAAPLIDADTALATLLKDRPRRALLIRIDQWESSTYKFTTLFYDLTATVYDARGQLLASQHLTGKDELGGQLLGAARRAREVVPAALPGKIDALLNAAAIRAALQS